MQPKPKETPLQKRTRLLSTHLSMLRPTLTTTHNNLELPTAPIFTSTVLHRHSALFTQYGFLAGISHSTLPDPRVYFNISAPSSAFICGSQGSGKSHTLSALLENCLMRSHVSKLEHPLAGLVFHYDDFSGDEKGMPCEVAYLASATAIKVRVFCSPTNIATIKRTYAGLDVHVEPLLIDETNLNTKRMLDLMAVSPDSGPIPLYLHAITRILRELRIAQQASSEPFNYSHFKNMVEDCDMTPTQLSPLTMRLDILESFMPKSQTTKQNTGTLSKKQKKKLNRERGNDWTIKPSTLTIIDLSCPCVTPESACALFNICLDLFLEQKTNVGRIIALDEAHKYMNESTAASTLTNTLLKSIRLQRHLGTRVFVSTQEPTISPKLLDLCSVTVVHRFSSPEWLRCLRGHLAALDEGEGGDGGVSKGKEVFAEIVGLGVGEALVFAPSAMVGKGDRTLSADVISVDGEMAESSGGVEITRLGTRYLKVQVRGRITADGGASIMAK